jgi:hypothetical protein
MGDKSGSGSARNCKIHATSYSTFNGLTCKNAVGNFDGMILNYYSSHNTFNNCIITNNAGDGIKGYGNYNQYNTFNNCTVSGNTIYQLYAGGPSALGTGDDHHWTINGGTYTGVPGLFDVVFAGGGNYQYIHDATFNGPGTRGLDITANNACVNNNTFSGFTIDIVLNGTNNLGSGNITPGGTIPALITGTCP